MKTLIIDDKEENLYLLEIMLKSIGHEVVSASNGAEALEKLNSEDFDLIVSDILMPEMDGYQLCRKVKMDDKLKDIPFVFYTATYTEEKDEEFALKLGVDKFIRKPMEPDEFLKIIQDLMKDAVEGKIKRAEPVLEDEKEVFKMYSERLVKKLEKKMLELERTEKELRKVNRAFETLSRCNQVIIRAKEESNLLNEICKVIVDIGGYRLTWVGFAEQDKEKTVRPVAQVGHEDGYLDTIKVTWADNERGRGPTATAIRTGKPSIMRNILSNPDFLPWRDDAAKCGYKSSIALPLITDEQVLGALNIYASEPDAFDAEEVKLLTELADDMTFGIMTLRTRAERKKAVDEIRKLSRAIEQSPTLVVITDTKGDIEYVNPKFTQVSGYTFDEVIGKNPRILKSGETPLDKYKELWDTITSGGEWRGELHNKKKNGELYWESEIISPIRDSKGEITHFIGVKEDITERKQMEQMLIQSEKMASIGILAAGIAHEINNPTGYIHSNLETLKEYNEDINSFFSDLQTFIEECSKIKSEIIEDLIDKLKKSKEDREIDYLIKDGDNAIMESLDGSERIKKIVSDLKDFSREEKPEMKLTKINDGIEKTLNVVWNELKYKAEVIKEFGDIPEIECDINKLAQVFMNILVNAAQAIEKRGKITIKTFTENNYVVIKISDTGKGIPGEHISKIFEAFFTTKEPGKGTGLGLSISYKIIQEHNGTIDVESEVGKGTTFTIKLPAKKSD